MYQSNTIYFVLISTITTISLVWGFKRVIKFGLDLRLSLDLFLCVLIFGFIGARAFHVFYEHWAFYQQNRLEIFYVWNGGFVFYGGLLSAMISGFFFLLYKKWELQKLKISLKTGDYFDLIAPLVAFGYSFGRLACLQSGCCYGKYCDLPWAIEGRHPTQLYAFSFELLNLMCLLLLEKWIALLKLNQHKGLMLFVPGVRFAIWLLVHALGRILIEYFRGDDRGPIYLFSVSTWISLGLAGGSIFFLSMAQWNLVREKLEDKT